MYGLQQQYQHDFDSSNEGECPPSFCTEATLCESKDETSHTFEFEQHSAQLLIRRICNPLYRQSGSRITRAVTDIRSISAVTTTVPVDGLLVLPRVDLFFDIIDSISAIQSSDSTYHNVTMNNP
jgi:hypothetical protein